MQHVAEGGTCAMAVQLCGPAAHAPTELCLALLQLPCLQVSGGEDLWPREDSQDVCQQLRYEPLHRACTRLKRATEQSERQAYVRHARHALLRDEQQIGRVQAGSKGRVAKVPLHMSLGHPSHPSLQVLLIVLQTGQHAFCSLSRGSCSMQRDGQLSVERRIRAGGFRA